MNTKGDKGRRTEEEAKKMPSSDLGKKAKLRVWTEEKNKKIRGESSQHQKTPQHS